MSDGFDGFPVGGLEFLAELGSQDKAWFDAHRATYQSEVAQPAKDFVVALTEALHSEISEGIVGQPKVNGSIAPINNDLRQQYIDRRDGGCLADGKVAAVNAP